MDSGLTDAEQFVMDALVKAWNEWKRIPDTSRDEMREFQQAIHVAQMVIASRIVRRAYPEYWR